MNSDTDFFASLKSGLLVPEDSITPSQHSAGDLHFIGEALPAPSEVKRNDLSPSVGISPVPSREDHVHGTSAYERPIFSTVTEMVAWGGALRKGMLCYTEDFDFEYIYNGTNWVPWTGPVFGRAFAWGPSFIDLTLSGGSILSYYTMIAQKVFIDLTIILGSAPTWGAAPRFTLPWPFSNVSPAWSGNDLEANGSVTYYDATGPRSRGFTYKNNSNELGILYHLPNPPTNVLGAPPTATTPFTFAVNDRIHVTASYDAFLQ